MCTRFTDTLSRCCPPTGDTVTAAVCVIPTGTLSSGAPPLSSDASSDWTDATLEAGDDGSTADAASGDDGSAADSASGDDATDAEAATGVDAGDGGDAAEDVGTSE